MIHPFVARRLIRMPEHCERWYRAHLPLWFVLMERSYGRKKFRLFHPIMHYK
jgi:hypothetical protein